MEAISTSPAPSGSRKAFLHEVALRDIPLALMVTGVVVLVVGTINFLVSDRLDPTDVIPDAIVAAALITWSALLRRVRVPPQLLAGHEAFAAPQSSGRMPLPW